MVDGEVIDELQESIKLKRIPRKSVYMEKRKPLSTNTNSSFRSEIGPDAAT
jgi:hypothetical protein